jgi:dephospho-CoA kinase
MARTLIVCITGMPGAGKTTVAEVLKSDGFMILNMGDVVREEAKKRRLPLDDASLGKLMLKLRRDLGPGAIAHLIAERIREREKHGASSPVAIDGLRSMQEVDVLRKYGMVKVLAIHAPKEARFRFLKGRKRTDAPRSQGEFDSRDKREIGVGIGEAISFSDSVITNDGTIKDLQKRALEIVNRWKKEVEGS